MGGSKSSSSKVDVYVGSGSLQLIISGGYLPRSVRQGRSLVIDASRSYDENLPRTLSGVAAGLSYAWSCVQTEPVLRLNCEEVMTMNTINISSIPSITWIVNSDSSVVGSKVVITVTITDIDRSRS